MLNKIHLVSPTSTFLVLLAALNIYPFYQILFFGEPPFYQNAFDEYSYLQYDFSQKTLGIGRILQVIPNFLHQIGISGGIQNFFLDLICLIIFFLSISAIFKNKWIGILVTLGPLLFLSVNPVVSLSIGRIFSNDTLIKYITFPEAWFLPISRSPEPQLSLTLLAITTLITLRLKKPFLILLIIPLLYSFVIIPTLTVLLIYYSCIFLKDNIPKLSNKIIFTTSIVLGFISTTVSLLVYFNYTEGNPAFTQSHLPFFPLTIIFTAAVFFFGKFVLQPKNLTFQNQSLLIALVATQIIIVNTQLITGYINQPNNFEQNINVFIPVVLLSIFITNSELTKKQIFFRIFLPFLLVMPFFLYKHLTFVTHNNQQDFLDWVKLKKETDILEKLQAEPQKVLLEKFTLSSKISALAYPKQSSLPFDYPLTYFGHYKKENLQHYIDAKSYLKSNFLITETLQETLKRLDKAYQGLNMDFILLHLNRRDKPFKNYNSLDDFTPKPNKTFYLYKAN